MGDASSCFIRAAILSWPAAASVPSGQPDCLTQSAANASSARWNPVVWPRLEPAASSDGSTAPSSTMRPTFFGNSWA
jgi:hypothetical protein